MALTKPVTANIWALSVSTPNTGSRARKAFIATMAWAFWALVHVLGFNLRLLQRVMVPHWARDQWLGLECHTGAKCLHPRAPAGASGSAPWQPTCRPRPV